MKTNKPLISILVPTYNRLNYLKECLDSIVLQKWFLKSDLELIVSDNSDNYETKDFIDSYIKKYNNWNIIYNKNKKNLWMVWNWNKLLELKKWEYFVFLSDDDKFYNENSLKILYDNLIKYNLDVCYWKYMCFDENGKNLGIFQPHSKVLWRKIYKDTFSKQLLVHSISFGWILYKNFDKFYDNKAWFCADWDFNLQYLKERKKVWLIDIYTFLYRFHLNQTMSSVKFKEYLLKYSYIYYKYKRFHFMITSLIFIFLNKTWIFKKTAKIIKKFLKV